MATSRVQQQLFFVGSSNRSSNSNSSSSSSSLNTKTTGPLRSPTADGSSPAVVMHPTINYKEVSKGRQADRRTHTKRKEGEGGGDFLLPKRLPSGLERDISIALPLPLICCFLSPTSAICRDLSYRFSSSSSFSRSCIFVRAFSFPPLLFYMTHTHTHYTRVCV